VALEEDEEEKMWDKGVLGVSTPFALQFSVWFYFTLMMGLRGRDEHRGIKFGDIHLKCDVNNKEFLELTERSSKTRDGTLVNDRRATVQKIFCTCDSTGADRCIVEIWKAFVSHRPVDYCQAEDPLYLACKTDEQIRKTRTNIWFKHQPLGANSLGKFLPKACLLAGLPPRGNHGVRASTVQRLRKSEVPDDQIIQITGHKSVRTLQVYDTNQLSTKVHKKCQQVLQKPHAAGSAADLEAIVPLPTDGVVAVPTTTACVSAASSVAIDPQSFGAYSMFSGAVFNQCNFNFGRVEKTVDQIEQ
jgi:hypothetical protein